MLFLVLSGVASQNFTIFLVLSGVIAWGRVLLDGKPQTEWKTRTPLHSDRASVAPLTVSSSKWTRGQYVKKPMYYYCPHKQLCLSVHEGRGDLSHGIPRVMHPSPVQTYYRLQKQLRKSNVFTSVCQEFCPQGRGVHPQADTPGQTPPWQADNPPPQMATAADGTHPTGMHSCSLIDPPRELLVSGSFVCYIIQCRNVDLWGSYSCNYGFVL